MNPITQLFLFVIGPALALVAGCLGAELIEETILGWPLFCAGASYPPGAVIYYRRYIERTRAKSFSVEGPGSRPVSRPR